MKTKFIKFMGVMLIALFMVSCGGKETVTSKKIKLSGIYGDDANLISVVSDTCLLNLKDGILRLNVQLKLEKTADNEVDVYPILVLKDEDGVQVINGKCQMGLGDSEKSKFDMFVKGEAGSVADFVFVSEFQTEYCSTALAKSETFSIDKLSIKEIEEKDIIISELETLNQIAKEAAKMAEDYDDEDYERALENAERSLKAAEKVLEMEENLLDMMDDLDW